MIEIGIITLIMTIVMFVLCVLNFLLGNESTRVFSHSRQMGYLALSLYPSFVILHL